MTVINEIQLVMQKEVFIYHPVSGRSMTSGVPELKYWKDDCYEYLMPNGVWYQESKYKISEVKIDKKERATWATDYGVFLPGHIVGLRVQARNWEDLINNRLPKFHKSRWEYIQFRDEEGRMIQITREFIYDQGMDYDEVVYDWMEHNEESFDDEIVCLGKTVGQPIKF